MKNSLLLLIRFFFFWLFLFFLSRCLFVLYFVKKFDGIPFTEVLQSFVKALPLDIAAACYIISVAVLALLLQQIIPASFYKIFLAAYSGILLVLFSCLVAFDLGIYEAWETKLNYRAISFLWFVGDGVSYLKAGEIILFFVEVIALTGIGWIVFRKWVSGKTIFPLKRNLVTAFLCLLLFPLLFVGLRGGLQLIPINESRVYFSSHQVVNDAAVNTLWYSVNSMAQNYSVPKKNPYEVMKPEVAEQIIENLYRPGKDSVISVLTTQRPNIVVIILESFTADVVEAMGGIEGVSDHLDSLIQQGILFTSIYSQGLRTDQGIVNILSAFPSQPDFSVITQTEKIQHLDFLPQQFAKAGYHTSYFYGGELGFTNMKSYLTHAGFLEIHGKESFTAAQLSEKWGAHDEYVFEMQAKEMEAAAEPFFSVIQLSSSHEPYDVPLKSDFYGKSRQEQFINSCYYTDECLGDYFRSVRKESWYPNTLFILVADHGVGTARQRAHDSPARFRMPLIFFGDVLKQEYRGVIINSVGMQVDVAATLLPQLGMSAADFVWSNNLLNPFRKNFAYYTFDSGYGFVKDGGYETCFFSQKTCTGEGLSENDKQEGQAFLQLVFEEFQKY